MRDSRIPHPLGGRFVQLHVWAVEAIGFSAAAVLGLLDYLDRMHDRPGEMLATRARVIADLQGVVGRNSVDRALDDLVARDWVELHEITATGANITTTHWYSLGAGAIGQYLHDCGKAGVPKSGRRKSRNRDRNRDRSRNANQLPDTDVDHHPCGGIEWPAQLAPAQRAACARELSGCTDDLRTTIVRELSHRLTRTRDPLRLPHMWVRTLVLAAGAGTLVRLAAAAPLTDEQRAGVERDYQRRTEESRRRGETFRRAHGGAA